MAGKRKTLSAYEEGAIADMMLGSGIWVPFRSAKATRVARGLARKGYIRHTFEGGGDPTKGMFVPTAKGRNYYRGRLKDPKSVSAKREARRFKRYARRTGTERARLRAALKDV